MNTDLPRTGSHRPPKTSHQHHFKRTERCAQADARQEREKKSPGNSGLYGAQISFSLYDDSGAQVGTAIANINGLEPGNKWKFEAISFGQEFTKYQFIELTGF
jgi:hypothetical protein